MKDRGELQPQLSFHATNSVGPLTATEGLYWVSVEGTDWSLVHVEMSLFGGCEE